MRRIHSCIRGGFNRETPEARVKGYPVCVALPVGQGGSNGGGIRLKKPVPSSSVGKRGGTIWSVG